MGPDDLAKEAAEPPVRVLWNEGEGDGSLKDQRSYATTHVLHAQLCGGRIYASSYGQEAPVIRSFNGEDPQDPSHGLH